MWGGEGKVGTNPDCRFRALVQLLDHWCIALMIRSKQVDLGPQAERTQWRWRWRWEPDAEHGVVAVADLQQRR
jgi:hypothetical protein